ncbi:Heme exporter protein D (fragment) [Sphingomonas sp. EC-HK361]
MSQWLFVAAAYAVTLIGAVALAIVSYAQMRKAER